ncbi:MAG: PmoA family protein [Candidatus Solibacter sp.]
MKQACAFLLCAGLAALPLAGQVKITSSGDKASVEIGGKPFTDFYMAGEAFQAKVTKPYLWPLRAASGTAITRAWPMAEVADEQGEKKPQKKGPPASDHQHQRGLWFAHDNVNKLDFWNNEWSYHVDDHRPNLGRMNLKGAAKVTSGKNSGTIAATFEWTDIEGSNPILTEQRVMTFYDDPKLRYFDVDVTLKAITQVVFGDGKDGAFGIRMRPALQEDKGHARITNADGMVGEKDLWGKPSAWCDYSGEVNGETLGVAILDHVENPRHPARWHARGYGLFAVNPWGLSVFTNDKSQDGSMTLEPGKTVRYRYRVVIHPGTVKDADIAGLYAKYVKK